MRRRWSSSSRAIASRRQLQQRRHDRQFRQDEARRGIWRRQHLVDYAAGKDTWETLLDLDALAAREGKNWVYKGVSCRPPEYDDCLLQLSDGGKDAVTIREFDRATRTWVEGGFMLEESKGGASWVDENTLLDLARLRPRHPDQLGLSDDRRV
jgi:prolyl oligopeptidase